MHKNKLKHYEHLSQEEREKIMVLVHEWKSIREIARILHRSPATISRELERNWKDLWFDKYEYSAKNAQTKYAKRRINQNYKHNKFIKNPDLRNKLKELLEKYWPFMWPDEIVHRLEAEKHEKIPSTSTIYRYLRWYGKRYACYLRHKSFGYMSKWQRLWRWKYKDIPYIELRSYENENRLETRHLECDTIVSCRSGKWWVVTMVDRKSRFVFSKKISDLKWETVYKAMKELIQWENIKSLTIDNWSEFSHIREFLNDGIEVYHCHPYASYQKWSNEKNNWYFRWWLPKGCNINEYSDEFIEKIVNSLNHKPRKILWYKTPYEVFYNTTEKIFK